MVTFEEALNIVLESSFLIETEGVSLPDASGRVLAQDVVSDVDMPPFDKSAMDGYACRRDNLTGVLEIIETIPAGAVPEKKINPGQCARIMTGARIPEGADCVIKVEETETTAEGEVRFIAGQTRDNIARKAEDARRGDIVLGSGMLLAPQHIAVLASVGCTFPIVFRKPRVAILSTGDEIVEPDLIPGPSQVRNSNAWQLIAQVKRAGGLPFYHGIIRDSKDETRIALEKALAENDIVLLSGGVSMGDYDFVPGVFEALGLEIRFRTIAIQPGKPTVFAVRGDKRIFGLPGNPVSSFNLFTLLVAPLIGKMTGRKAGFGIRRLPMGAAYQRKKSDRLSWIPVSFSEDGKVYPVEYHGSAHIHALAYADGIAAIEAGRNTVNTGEFVDVRFI